MNSHTREMTPLRINAKVTGVAKKKPKGEKARLVDGRLDQAMERADYKTDVALAAKVGVNSTQIGRWRIGETVPEGRTYARLCAALGILPGWLFGEDLSPEDARKEVTDLVERNIGKWEASAIQLLGTMSEEVRAKVVASMVAFSDAERRQKLMRVGWEADVFGPLPTATGPTPPADVVTKPDPEAIEKQHREPVERNPKKPGK
jgi:transcriptional regulator with XRE-family HTH domain